MSANKLEVSKPFTDSSGILSQPEALRERARDDGYIFVKGLLERAVVLSLREDFARILHEHNWLDEGTDRLEARSTQTPRLEGQPEYWPVFNDYWRLESYHALAHRPELINIAHTILDDDVFPHPRHGSRVVFPKSEKHSTPPHQDHMYIQGSPDMWTAWIPLGDCPLELGGLAIMPRTHQQGILPVRPMTGAGGYGISDAKLPGVWHASGFECGDVLFFHSMAVHRGLHNLTRDRIRLSVDYRYQAKSQPIVEDGLLPTFSDTTGMTWEKIYENWPTDRYKYYWKRYDLEVVPRDNSIIRLDENVTDEELAAVPKY